MTFATSTNEVFLIKLISGIADQVPLRMKKITSQKFSQNYHLRQPIELSRLSYSLTDLNKNIIYFEYKEKLRLHIIVFGKWAQIRSLII